MKLTAKQKAFLAYLSRYLAEWGTAPSFDEMCAHFGFRSYNTVSTYLRILERKGYVRLPGKKNRKRGLEVLRPVEARRCECPVLGKVAAGKPIEAAAPMGSVEVPPSMAANGAHFVLQVNGASMEEDGILDGDLVVVRKQPDAENGEIVVAVINHEATVKRYYKREDHIELRPAHRGMASFRINAGDLRIEGKVVGVMRYYR